MSFGAMFMRFWSFIEEIWSKQCSGDVFLLTIFSSCDNFTEKDSIIGEIKRLSRWGKTRGS